MLGILLSRFREVLRSREVFRNWLSAAIHYALINPRALYRRLPNLMGTLGRGCINVSCRNGGRVCIDPTLYTYVTRGFYLGFIREVTCDEEGGALVINGLKVKLAYNGDYFDLGSAKFKRMYFTVLETFAKQEYGLVDVRGRVIVDVGAFVGDTAIYFVLKGARKVYAVEPHPGAYQEMLENIKLNNMQGWIVPINVALGSKPGKVKVMDEDAANTIGAYHGLGSGGDIEVPMITLGQLVMDYGIEPDVLKMDCEGCEYDVILNDYEHVRLFKELIFECHEGRRNSTELLSKLSNDYKCETIRGTGITIVHCMKLNEVNWLR